MPNWELDEKYTLIKRLGQGSGGSVFSAKNKLTGEKVAIKEVYNIFDDYIGARRMLREISVMILLTHPCIIKIKEVIIKNSDFNTLFIVMEYAETDLRKIIKSPSFLDHEQVRYLFYQALVGLRYMHSANILHRDLKPANILINSDCSLKICDFGLSRSMETSLNITERENIEVKDAVEPGKADILMRELFIDTTGRGKKRKLSGHVVTRWYRAPELILLDKNYDRQIDVWSLGCVFAELLTMMRDNAPYYIERGPIFPGKSCFPLSPDIGNSSFKNGYPASDKDQLNVIMEILGTPCDEDLQCFDNSMAISYIKSFSINEKKPLNLLFPGSTPEEIDVLTKMLVFNRQKRITLDELLEHPYFQNIRNSELEILATIPANFEFDRSDSMDINELKDIFMRQVTNII